MLGWAEHRFTLSKPDQSGVTLKEHLESVERQIGFKPPELVEPFEFPSVLSKVWSAFCTLSNRRTAGDTGVQPITFEQVKAWKDLTEARVEPWELDVIFKLDDTFRKVANT